VVKRVDEHTYVVWHISNPKACTFHKVFRLFQKLIQDDPTHSGRGQGTGEDYPSTVHCETALLLLHKYLNQAMGAYELLDLFEVRIHILINYLVLNVLYTSTDGLHGNIKTVLSSLL
jgi:hypothetical protein